MKMYIIFQKKIVVHNIDIVVVEWNVSVEKKVFLEKSKFYL